ncbi:hypothetical protein WG899_19160 [Paucibacter sp. AS339]|uniref:hypothetical protein n=1 Tax=Paucibacter hankyongi TaxID=3133434 RepID=UPI0030A1C5B3
MNPARILLVEDEAVVALELAMRLKSYGYVIVDTVITGEQALLAAVAQVPELVLMDNMIQGRSTASRPPASCSCAEGSRGCL